MKVGGTSMSDILMNLNVVGIPKIMIVDFNGWHNRKLFISTSNDKMFIV